MISKDTEFTQKMLLPKSASKGNNEKLSAKLPINVSNHLELYTYNDTYIMIESKLGASCFSESIFQNVYPWLNEQ